MPNPFAPSYTGTFGQPQPEDNPGDSGLWHGIKDVAAAPFRGVVGAAQGVYGLADAVAGDALPDWKTNPLGESDTIVGGLVQGASQFLVGFLPGMGVLSKVGKLGGLVDLTAGAEEAATAAGLAGKAAAIATARGLTAGAVSDLLVWQGHQQRLSNLVQEFPALQNPVTEFLSAKDTDPEIVGRLKGVLEGAGLGAMAEGFLMGLRKLRVYAKTSEELTQAAEEAGELTPDKQAEIHVEAAQKAEEAVPEAAIKVAHDTAVQDDGLFAPKPADPIKESMRGFKYPVTSEGIAQAATDNPRGFTMDARTGTLLDASTDKWAVPDITFGTTTALGGPEDVTHNRAIDILSSVKQSDAPYIGGWHNPETGHYELNPVRLFNTKEEAQAWAKTEEANYGRAMTTEWRAPEGDTVPAFGDQRVAVPEPRVAFNLKTGELFNIDTGSITKSEPANPRSNYLVPAAATPLKGTSIVDSAGNLVPVYHGTSRDFNLEEIHDLSHFGTRGAAMDRLLARDLDGQNIREVFLDIKRPFRVTDMGANGTSELADAMKDAGMEVPDSEKLYRPLGVGVGTGTRPNKDSQYLIDILRENGYDGLVYKNEGEDVGRDSYVIFDKSQVHARADVVNQGLATHDRLAQVSAHAQAIQDKYLSNRLPEDAINADALKPQDATGVSPAAPAEAIDAASLKASSGGAGAGEPPATGTAPGAAPEPRPEGIPQGESPLSQAVSRFADRLVKFGGATLDDVKKAIAGIDNIIKAHADAGVPLAVNPDKLSGAELVQLHLNPKELNLANFSGPDQVLAYARTVFDLFEEANKAWMGKELTTQTLKEQNAAGLTIAANMLNGDVPSVAANLSRHLDALEEGTRALSARIIGTRYIVSTMGQAAIKQIDLIEAIAQGSATGHLETEVAKALQTAAAYNETMRVLRGSLGEVARALGGQRSVVKAGAVPLEGLEGLLDNLPEIKRVVNDAGGLKDVMDRLRKVRAVYSDGNLPGVTRAMAAFQKGPWRRSYDAFMEYWVNALLAGPKTAVVNAMGPGLFSIYKPLEALMGSGLMKGLAAAHGDSAASAAQSNVVRELVAQMSAMTTSASEAFATARKLGMEHPDVFDARSGSSVMDPAMRAKAITPENLGIDPASTAGAVVTHLGNVVRIPSNVLGTTDNMLKMLNYRAAAVGRLTADAAAQGMDSAGIQKYVADTMDRLIWDHQVYSAKQLERRGFEEATKAGLQGEDALAYAAKYASDMMKAHPEDAALADFAKAQGWSNTLTTPAVEGSWSWSLQNLMSQHPVGRLVLPFINTPINIINAATQRLDVYGPSRTLLATVFPSEWTNLGNSRNAFIRDVTSGDPRRKAEAVGRIATGAALATTVYGLAGSGIITGKGPADPAAKKTLTDAGWQEYSIKTPNGYVSYARMDPIASLVGTVADLVEYGRYAPVEDQNSFSTASMGIAVALANNLTNKTYVAGLANFLDAAREPDKYVQSVTNRYAASLVPNILGQAVPSLGGDPVVRDVRTWIDAMASKVPGLSATLPPQRNVLGEPIARPMSLGGELTDWWLPLAYREVSDDAIKLELAAQGHGFTPPKHTLNGTDLSDIRVGNTTAYDRWGELQGTVTLNGMNLRDALRKLIASPAYQQAISGPVGETMSPRVNMLNTVIFRYRDAAYARLLRESPEMAAIDAARVQSQRAAKRGDILTLLSSKVQ